MLGLRRLRQELNSHPVDLSGLHVQQSRTYFRCRHCAGMVDRRLLGDVLWHEEAACGQLGWSRPLGQDD